MPAHRLAAFPEWDRVTGERFADLKGIRHPALVVQGFNDQMIPVRNSYWLAENLPTTSYGRCRSRPAIVRDRDRNSPDLAHQLHRSRT